MKRFFGAVAAFIMLTGFSVENPMAKTERLDWFKEEFLSRINGLRQRGCNCGKLYMPPVGPVSWNTELETAAYWHAKDMVEKKYFSHVSLDGRKLMDRVSATGYSTSGYKSYSIGENIAQGQRSIKEVMDAWVKSEAHCKNLMAPAFKDMGVAIVGNYYWVQDFGGREPFKTQAAVNKY